MKLTKRQLEVLRVMRDENEDLVYERGQGYVGNEKISARTLFALLRACAISKEVGSQVGKFERYSINGTGKEYLARERKRKPMTIKIHKSPTADTRTCDFANVTKDTLRESSIQHISDVRKAIAFFRDKLIHAANVHDFDKLGDIDGFHRDFVTGFKRTEWWDAHRKLNRHHLLEDDGVPSDVNLIDVLDMIADCVMAGMARSGSVYPLNIKPEVLMAAFTNTVEMLKAEVVVE